MSKHTPGPWEPFRPGSLKIWASVNEGLHPIAEVFQLPCIGGHGDIHAQAASDQEQANARLISAAPELLAALKWALDQIDDDLDHDHQEAFRMARAAVYKAEGV
jgi:hypothetical protein